MFIYSFIYIQRLLNSFSRMKLTGVQLKCYMMSIYMKYICFWKWFLLLTIWPKVCGHLPITMCVFRATHFRCILPLLLKMFHFFWEGIPLDLGFAHSSTRALVRTGTHTQEVWDVVRCPEFIPEVLSEVASNLVATLWKRTTCGCDGLGSTNTI